MESAGETTKEGGGGATSVRNILLGSGPGSLNFWGGDLGFVVGNVPEAGGAARGILKAYTRAEDNLSERRYLAMCGRREFP